MTLKGSPMATATAPTAPALRFHNDGRITRDGAEVGQHRIRNTRPGAMLGGFGSLPKYDVYRVELATGAVAEFKSWARAKAWAKAQLGA